MAAELTTEALEPIEEEIRTLTELIWESLASHQRDHKKPTLRLSWCNRDVVIGPEKYLQTKGAGRVDRVSARRAPVWVIIGKFGGKLPEVPYLFDDTEKDIELMYVIPQQRRAWPKIMSRRPIELKTPGGFSAWILPLVSPEQQLHQFWRIPTYPLTNSLETRDLLQSVVGIINEGEVKNTKEGKNDREAKRE